MFRLGLHPSVMLDLLSGINKDMRERNRNFNQDFYSNHSSLPNIRPIKVSKLNVKFSPVNTMGIRNLISTVAMEAAKENVKFYKHVMGKLSERAEDNDSKFEKLVDAYSGLIDAATEQNRPLTLMAGIYDLPKKVSIEDIENSSNVQSTFAMMFKATGSLNMKNYGSEDIVIIDWSASKPFTAKGKPKSWFKNINKAIAAGSKIVIPKPKFYDMTPREFFEKYSKSLPIDKYNKLKKQYEEQASAKWIGDYLMSRGYVPAETEVNGHTYIKFTKIDAREVPKELAGNLDELTEKISQDIREKRNISNVLC
jgi:hypothetical protein